jgi:hypothetical protein
VLWICGEFFDRIGGSFEQSGITDTLVLPDERAQLFWDGEGNEEVMTWELALELFLEPPLSFVVLAGGAMAIAAGAKELARLGATLALVERDAASFRTTGRDGIDDFAMSLGHLGGVTLKVLGCEGSKDFMNGGHDRVPPSRD